MDLPTALVAIIAVAVIAYIVTVVHVATVRTLARRADSDRPEEGLLVWPKWLSALVAALLLLWLIYRVRGILLPFVVGAVIAYVLNPGIDALENRGWARTQGISLVFGVFLLVFVLGALLLIPALATEAQDLSARYGVYAQQWRDLVQQAEEKAEVWGQVVGVLPSDVRDAFSKVAYKAQGYALNLLQQGLMWLNRSLVIVSLLVITPVVTFWLLRDYHILGRRVLRSLPQERRERVVAVLRDINHVAGGYLLGMAVMAVIVGLYATILLAAAGVRFSVLLGIMTGVLSLIPYLGYPVSLVIIVAVMLVTGKSLGIILLVLGVMIVGNVISDYGVAPRVVGSRVGLHPLIVIFAVLAGGALLGFVGVVLAIPVAGAIKVVSLHFWPELFEGDRSDVVSAQDSP